MEIIIAAAIKKIQVQQPFKKILKANDIFADLWSFISSNPEKQKLGKIIYDEIINNRNKYPDIIDVGKYSNGSAYYKIN